MDRDWSRRDTARALLGGGLLAAADLPAARPSAAAARLFPDDGFWSFVARDAGGRPLGALVYRFARSPGRFLAAVESFYRLPTGGAPLELRHNAEELWRDGWLYGLDSRTSVGRRRHRVTLTRDDDALRGRRDGHAFSLSGYVVTASLWHPETPRLRALLDAATGRLCFVTGRRGARETVPLGRERVAATRWRLGGELERELWYDDAGRLVRLRFAGPEGSPVVLERPRL